MVWDKSRKKILLFGGNTAIDPFRNTPDNFVSLTDVWAWDGNVWTELPVVEAPSGRILFAMA
jgi:hypothetical protein